MKKINLTAISIVGELKKISSNEKRIVLQRFFKTGPGQYGEGDLFLGITVPQQRDLAKRFCLMPLNELEKMLKNKFHEVRLTALLILVIKFQKTKVEKEKKKYFEFYIKHLVAINNWDLVDVTTPIIVGQYLLDKPKKLLYKLARSKNLWERRISVLACYAFIKNNNFTDIINLAKVHLSDKHDLMHKAVGWMLREVGKRDVKVLKDFLNEHIEKMPRTALRYAIEHFPEMERKKYLKQGKV